MKICACLFLFAFICLFNKGTAQHISNATDRGKSIDPRDHKDQVKKRAEFFYKRRYEGEATNPEQKRWNAYIQSQEKSMSTRATPVADWKNCGPNNQGGRIICHAFDPFNSQIIYAGSAGGGLWKTTNSGESWIPLTDNIPSLAVGAVAVHPSNSNIILIGGGEGYLLSPWFIYGTGVLKSTDGGLTWNQTSLQFSDSLQFASTGMAWDPVNPNNVYLSTTFGIYVSTDMGDTWTLKLPGVGTSVVINKASPNIIYAGLQSYGGSTNGGIKKSVDNGNTWSALTSGLPISADFGFTSISICDAFPNVLYAGVSWPESSSSVGEMRGFYKTSNGGASWTSLNPSFDFYCYPAPYDDICQGWYDNITAVSPVDTNLVFTGGIYLYKTFDGGANWYYYDYAPEEEYPWVHPDHHSFAWDPVNNNIVYAFCDGGVYRSSNQGYDWYLKNNGLVTTQFYYIASSATNPNIALCGTQDNGSWSNIHIDTSKTWKQFQTGDGFAVNVDYGNEHVWYGSELYAKRFRVTLNGDSVEQRNTGITSSNYFTTPFIMHPTNRATFFTATDSEIYKTTDTCHNWSSVYATPYIQFFAFDHINTNVIYGVRDPYFASTTMSRSMDGGNTWTTFPLPVNKIIDVETDPGTLGVLYAVRSSYNPGEQVWKSLDYGVTWTNISGDFPGIPANTICINPANPQHIYVGTDLGVYLSIDGGITWTSFNDGLPNVMVTDMHFYEPDGTIRVGTHGRGYWITKAFAPEVLPGEFEACFNSTQIAPNPLTDETTISFSLSNPSPVTIKIYNSLGQCVNTLYDQNNGAGTYNVKWNGINANGMKVAAGVYYVRMICEGTAKTIKLNVSK